MFCSGDFVFRPRLELRNRSVKPLKLMPFLKFSLRPLLWFELDRVMLDGGEPVVSIDGYLASDGCGGGGGGTSITLPSSG